MNIKSKKFQHAVLAVIAGCGLFFLALYFFILPAISSWKENSAKVTETQKKLSEMRQMVQTRPVIQKQFEICQAAIKTMAGNIPLPVLGNYLLGMEEYIRRCAGDIGFNIVSVADNDVVEISSEGGLFKIYRVRVQGRAGFNDFLRLVTSIQGNNPLVSISGINIIARGDNPSAHELSFVVAWLVWSEPARRPAFLMEDKKN